MIEDDTLPGEAALDLLDDDGVSLAPVIGLAGRKYAGKDTAAKAFEAAGYTNLKFATPIKLMVGTLLNYQGVDEDTVYRMLEGDLKEVPTPFLGGRTPRHAMQTLGTEWGRQMIDPNLWIDALVNASDQYDLVVVSDVRFHNEVDALRNRCDADVYRVVRPAAKLNEDPHPSEAEVDHLEVDQEIINLASSAQEFAQQVARTFFDPGPESEDFH